jgi:formylmethanofuran dehydrogenase subunit B
MSAGQVCTWQAGFPLRTSFARGYPEHDTVRYAVDRMLRDRETDLLVWLATLLPEPVPDTACPKIVIGHPGTRFAVPPKVFLPAAIPGIDHAGHCFRTDGVVALPLRKLLEPRWPSLRQIVNHLLEAAC